MTNRTVALRIYVEPENIDKCQHAMTSLKKSMRWDEEVYGREYDLDIFMIVAVNDFNMGAMENKGLNIFNSSAVLARAETATDAAHQRVEAIVAHEYFHNWSGNRVTCRDWFQLSLKEGFTVFRDSCFSADMNSATVKRIQDVAYLRTHQFAEDAGPMAHAVRPDSFIEISNFYTLTVYEKGSEVVGMIHTLLGAEGFRKGSDLYFERHDGQAVTCDDFIKAMEDANGVDLTQFKRWYSQAGTPRLAVSESYDAAKTYSLTFRQSCPQTPDKVEKLPFVIPVELGLLDARQRNRLAPGGRSQAQASRVISVTEAEQTFTFVDIAEQPLPSLLRGFSAPVKLSFPYNRDQLMFLMQHDSDGFNRWDAGQQLSVQVLQELMPSSRRAALVLDQRLIGLAHRAVRRVAGSGDGRGNALAARRSLPDRNQRSGRCRGHSHRPRVRPPATGRSVVRRPVARYQANRELSKQTPYVAEAEHFARRALQNIALSYLMLSGKPEVLAATLEQFDTSDNMTERLTALAVLVNSPFEAQKAKALASFAEHFKDNPLVMDQWFSVQAGSPCRAAWRGSRR
jgi:aminopeptidase N